MQYPIPKGVFDILPQDPDPDYSWRNSDRWQYIEKIIRKTCESYGYKEVRTPIFERTELFVRGVGESSDIVNKEMYTFLDKADRSMTLRPEGTASLMRAFVEKKLYTQPTLHKYFYIGPMFRYERPQAGRYRQHHQFGAEALGIDKPEQDVELIDLATTLYGKLGLSNLKVMINSVGSEETRKKYMAALKAYLEPQFDQLSDDSKGRFHKNIFRILDSKDKTDQAILNGSPSILDFLSDADKTHFNKVCCLLEEIKIDFQINPKLVRGLDYYNRTVFEITTSDLGAQNSIGGGGRYDGLTETVGGPFTPSVGFATGIERVLQTMQSQNVEFPAPPHPFIYLIPMGEAALNFCFQLTSKLRKYEIGAETDLSHKKIQTSIQMANSIHADYVIVIGEQEMESNKATLKHLKTREIKEISLSQITEEIQNLHAKEKDDEKR
ncbi:MAG: histidine--tRNA ligase [Chlamydiae bacterium]|nr:histidine--tRNA ligase [Chlamydiota bacterium]